MSEEADSKLDLELDSGEAECKSIAVPAGMTIIGARPAHSVWSNTDLTEGKGWRIPIATCTSPTTAKRLARGKDVQGSNAAVKPCVALKVLIGGEMVWYGPIILELPTDDDVREDERLERRRKAIEAARAAGLTDDQIEALGEKASG